MSQKLTGPEVEALKGYHAATRKLNSIDQDLDIAEVERQNVAERIADLMQLRVEALEQVDDAVEALRKAIKAAG